MKVAPHAAVADKNGAAVDGEASEMEAVKCEDPQQASADRKKADQDADPEIFSEGGAQRQPVLTDSLRRSMRAMISAATEVR